MTEADVLYNEGVAAVRDQKNLADGRRLLTQSLRLDPANDMAWLWLSRTVRDQDQQLQCIERALSINPANPQAQALKEKLNARRSGANRPTSGSPPVNAAADRYLEQAQALLDDGNIEGAIAEWQRVLQSRPDHEIALSLAVRHLARLKRLDEAKSLVWGALDGGSTHPSVYLTAIELLKREGAYSEADHMRRQLVALPDANEAIISDVVDYFVRAGQIQDALDILNQALTSRPGSQKLLIRLGDLSRELGQDSAARQAYDQAARMGLRTAEGRQADERLMQFAPALTDKERGSKLLAVREVVGFSLFYLLLGWQDAGLDLLRLGGQRWLGVGLGTLGAYLLVTATSSPQQQPLAGWFGGSVSRPESAADREVSALPILPPPVRLVFGIAGLALLAAAFYLVFGAALGLITAPDRAPVTMPSMAEIFELE